MSSILLKKKTDWPKFRGAQAFFGENTDMFYSRHKKTPPESPKTPEVPQLPGAGDIWDTISAPLAGLWQGLGGKNHNYEQWIRDRARKRRGMRPQREGWLGRIAGT